MGRLASETIHANPRERQRVPTWTTQGESQAKEQVVISHTWQASRRLMTDYFGITRSPRRCQQALKQLECMAEEIESLYHTTWLSHELVACRNVLLIARCMVKAALARPESRGLHYWQDQPVVQSNDQQHSYVQGEHVYLS